MELFVLTALHLLMTVQSYKVPNVKVSPDVVRESNSTHLTCETPADVTEILCHFYAKKEENIKVSRSCDLQLTGAEVLLWTGEKSPVSLNIHCFYTTDVSGIHQSSSHSPPATVTILETLKKPFISIDDSTAQISISCEIPMTVRADFSCNLYTEDGPLAHRRHSDTRQSGEHYCTFYLSLREIFTQKQTENRRQLSCDYSPKMNPDLRSARSDPKTIRGIPQAKLSASSTNIMEKDMVRLICDNNENQKMEMCIFKLEGTENNIKQNKLCELSLTGSDIINWSGGQRSSVIIICYYTVYKTQVAVASPHSGPVTVTVQQSYILHPITNTPVIVTKKTTFSTAAFTHKTSTTITTTYVPQTNHKSDYKGVWLVVVLSTAVGIFLSVIIGIVCLYQCTQTCLHSCPMMEDSGAADVLTEVVFTTSTWQPKSNEHLLYKSYLAI